MSDEKITPPANIKKYELDASTGKAIAVDAEDHKRLMEAMAALAALTKEQAKVAKQSGRRVVKDDQNDSESSDTDEAIPKPTRKISKYTLSETLEKFKTMKKIEKDTFESYKTTIQEFEKFLKVRMRLHQIDVDHVVGYREMCASTLGNSPRTIDKKVGTLKALFNFAVDQRYTAHNPAAIKNLLTKRQKNSDGYAIFEAIEIERIFRNQLYKDERQKDPDFYWCTLLALLTGMRHDEATLLLREQIQQTESGIYYVSIRQGKTNAAQRNVPLPQAFMDHGFLEFINTKEAHEQIFKYQKGNALGKKFSRTIAACKVNREKLVFHSLRKFLNNALSHNKMPIEARCQFVGHEFDNVNVSTYSNKFNVDELHLLSSLTLEQVMKLTPITP